jgi:hypothetical protein
MVVNRVLEELKINLAELQTLIDKAAQKPLSDFNNSDKLRLTTINEYLCQALLYANNLEK